MKKLRFHEGPGTLATLSLIRALSDRFEDITLAIGDPAWNPSKRVLRLPGLPVGNLPRPAMKRLLAFLAHESWEARWSEWDPKDPRWWHADPQQSRPGLRALVNAYGDAYVDQRGSKEFPGVGMHLRELLIEEHQRRVKRGMPVSVWNLAVLVRQVVEGVATFEEVHRDFPLFRPALDRIEDLLRAPDLSSTERLIEQALAVYQRVKIGSVAPLGSGAEEAPPLAETVVGESAPEWIAETQEADEDAESLHRIVREFFPTQDEGTPDPRRGPVTVDGVPQVYSFDPRKDRVYPPSIRNAVVWPQEQYLDHARALVVQIRQALTVPVPQPRRRQSQGRVDRRDLARLVLGAGDVLQRRMRRASQDTAAALLWDESKTMAGPRIDAVHHLAHVWNAALGMLRIPTLMTGWTTYGPPLKNWKVYRQEALRFRTYREFDDTWDDEKVLKRLSMIDYQDGTPVGEALLYGLERLLERKERRKILFFMTDGEPSIAHHGSEKVHLDFILSVLQTARKVGVEVIGLGIQADLSHLFERWVRIDHPEDIFGRTTEELVATLRGRR